MFVYVVVGVKVKAGVIVLAFSVVWLRVLVCLEHIEDYLSIYYERSYLTMEKPILRKEIPKNYLDYIKETYQPKRTESGEAYDSRLTYITFEQSFMKSAEELQLIEKYGFAPIGFLVALRIQMSNGIGYGIPIKDRSLKKALCNIAIDTNIPPKTLDGYYQMLLEYGLLVIIEDSEGNQVLTNKNQLYNWENKEYTRWYNAEAQRKKRRTSKKKAEEFEIPMVDPNAAAEENTPPPADLIELFAPDIMTDFD